MRIAAVLLAAVVVTASCPPSSAAPTWHVVRGEFFDLYSDAGRASAVDAAVWLEQFRRTVGGLWRIDTKDISRATVLQFRSERGFEPYRAGKYHGGFSSAMSRWP